MLTNEKDWIEAYKKKGAFCIHDGNPIRPHALLTSGKHSSGFFNSGLVTEDPFLLENAAKDLVRHVQELGYDLKLVDRVIGPAMGGITFAYEIGRAIQRDCLTRCLTSFTEKDMLEGVELMTLKRTTLKPGEKILGVEDVLSTGSSVTKMSKAIKQAGGQMLPLVIVLVNRSGLSEIDGKKIIAIIDRPMPMWEPADCPLCKLGSKAIWPKGKENWDKLNAVY